MTITILRHFSNNSLVPKTFELAAQYRHIKKRPYFLPLHRLSHGTPSLFRSSVFTPQRVR